ncbi:SRPBCC family protein [bacterium]|nr:SRPBCC family protein [bacterium]
MKTFFSIAGVILGACIISFLLIGFFMPRLDYKIKFEVDQPVEQTFKAFMDVTLMGQWMTGFKRVETLSGKPGEVGSKYRLVFAEGDGDVIVDEEVIAVKENELFIFSMENDFLSGTGEFRFAEKEGKTEITYINDTAGKNIIYKTMLALFRSNIMERNTKDFEKLKLLIENSK